MIAPTANGAVGWSSNSQESRTTPLHCPCCGYQLRPRPAPSSEQLIVSLAASGWLPPPEDSPTTWRIVRAMFDAIELGVGRVGAVYAAMELERRTVARALLHTGLQPIQWLQLARVFRATVLLQQRPVRRVADVARAVGHGDAFTLSHALFRDTGLRPTTIRTLSDWRPVVRAFLERKARR